MELLARESVIYARQGSLLTTMLISHTKLCLEHRDVPLPWNDAGALTMHVPQDQSRLPEFFKIDVFHTFHKGILADLASNGIET